MDKRLRKQVQKVQKKFDKVNSLSATKGPEARKASKTMSDLWTKRKPTNTKGLWIAKHASM